MKPVQCCDCGRFTQDSIGSGQGIGQCAVYEQARQENLGAEKLHQIYVRLGNRLFWGNRGEPDRYCPEFKSAG